MRTHHMTFVGRLRRRLAVLAAGGVLVGSLVAASGVAPAGAGASGARTGDTSSPIKHVIVIIGENHTFDNVFATYQPPKGQTLRNLLSEGIVTASGDPGPNVVAAVQRSASDTATVGYQVSRNRTGSYANLPQPNTTYVPKACDGQDTNTPDSRFPSNLANAPYQITKYVPYFDSHGAYSAFGT